MEQRECRKHKRQCCLCFPFPCRGWYQHSRTLFYIRVSFVQFIWIVVSLTSITRLNCGIRDHSFGESQVRMEGRGVFLSSSRIGPMQENISLVVVKRKLPSIQGVLSSRLEEGSKHPVSSSRLQNWVNDQSA